MLQPPGSGVVLFVNYFRAHQEATHLLECMTLTNESDVHLVVPARHTTH